MIPTWVDRAGGSARRPPDIGAPSRPDRPNARRAPAPERPAGASLTGYRSALLVGGGSAIGEAVVAAVLAVPGRVVLAGRPSSRLDEAANRLRTAGHRVDCMPYDAGWATQPTNGMVDAVWADHGGFDLVVIAVGCMSAGREGLGEAGPGGRDRAAAPEEASDEAVSVPGLEALLRTNLVGPALVANRTAGHLAAQGHGALVVVTSAAAVRPRQEVLAYAAAKQSLDTLARGLDQRLRPHGARCLVVRPGQVDTPMTAGMPRVPLTTGPEHVAERVRAALAGDRCVVWSPRGMGLLVTALRLIPSALLPSRLR
ncbi:MAG: SDR family NAD(P)-dependent oxidoreductase [Actinomycetes bacterium]